VNIETKRQSERAIIKKKIRDIEENSSEKRQVSKLVNKNLALTVRFNDCGVSLSFPNPG
jgi:hypothetical protein